VPTAILARAFKTPPVKSPPVLRCQQGTVTKFLRSGRTLHGKLKEIVCDPEYIGCFKQAVSFRLSIMEAQTIKMGCWQPVPPEGLQDIQNKELNMYSKRGVKVTSYSYDSCDTGSTCFSAEFNG